MRSAQLLCPTILMRCLTLLVIPFGGGNAPMFADEAREPKTVRDLLWVWANPEMTEPGEHTLATFAQAGPSERARLLGVPNIVLAGRGVPDDQAEALRITQEASSAARLIWEVMPDEGLGPPFVYHKRMAQIRELYEPFPQIEGVLLDDMSTGKIDRGFKPEHIRHIREQLGDVYPAVKVWGVVYTMSFTRENMNDYIRELDGISLWEWHADRVADLEKHVAHIEEVAPDKPILLGLYLFDYGNGRNIPLELLKLQCETALKLAHERRIEGIVFLTITNDEQAVGWTAEWVRKVGDERL